MASKARDLGHYESPGGQYDAAGHHMRGDDFDDYSYSTSDFDDEEEEMMEEEMFEGPFAEAADARGDKSHRGRYRERDSHGRYKSSRAGIAESDGRSDGRHYSTSRTHGYTSKSRGVKDQRFHPNAPAPSSAYPVEDDYDRYRERRADYYYGQPDTQQRYAGRYPVMPRAAAAGAAAGTELVASASAHTMAWEGRVFQPPVPPPPRKQVEESPVLQLSLERNPLLEAKITVCVAFTGTINEFREGKNLEKIYASRDPVASWGIGKLKLIGDTPTRENLKNVVITKIEACGIKVPPHFPWTHAAINLMNANKRTQRTIKGHYVTDGDTEPHLLVVYKGQESDYNTTLYDWADAQEHGVDPTAIQKWLHVTEKDFFAGHRYLPKPGSDDPDTSMHYFPRWNRALNLIDQNEGRYGKDGYRYSDYKMRMGEARKVDREILIPVPDEMLQNLVMNLEQDVHESSPAVAVDEGLIFRLSLPGEAGFGCPSPDVQDYQEEISKFGRSSDKVITIHVPFKITAIVPASESAIQRARAKVPSK